ncbi:MAG: RluA family pseudouridine synthase [Deltaproteobacteria bacterium]|nr:MAG: RluA family pseudouridine synthase [Deltaproteobacteria bacterium]
MVRFVVGEDEAGSRLDLALASASGVSRAQVRRWIEGGRVRINSRTGRPAQRVRAGDRLEADPPQPLTAAAVPEAIPIQVLYEDEDLVVVDKPAGLVVHPAPGHPRGTLVNALLHHCADLAGVGGVLRPGIVHRLDRGTSGVMVIAKRDAAHHALAAQFQAHTVERVYEAIVRGVPGADAGRVDRPIGRHPRDRKRMSVRTRSGREAHTAWRIRERFPVSGYSWLAARPETGRTHQIRVHLACAGLPIAGDAVYGRGGRGRLGLDRPALHAALLGFEHPASGERLRFEAPLAEDFAAALERLRSREPRR